MKRWKITWEIASKVLLFAFLFFMILLLASANWFLANFNHVDFSIALYQLFSPLKGTEAGLLSDYVNTCLYPSAFFAVAGTVGYTLYDMMAGRIYLETKIQIGKLRLCIGGGG